MSEALGERLPSIVTMPPGPASRALANELRRWESPNVTYVGERFPVMWEEARGANVKDVDGNVYVDLTGAFAVAAAGHSHPAVVAAVQAQAGKLMHGMGDVHPPAIKVELLRMLAARAPGDLNRSILANSGAEAVEAALKTAVLFTGRPGVLAFRGAYHGLTMGALAVSGREDFKQPFEGQLGRFARFADYPNPFRSPLRSADLCSRSLEQIESLLDEAGGQIGAIIAEPIQGRGGDIVPPDGWLSGVRRICDERGLLLILDEIYTGFGRTGRWFASEHWRVVPDLMTLGKGLSSGMPFAACIGRDEVMEVWPVSTGEALHTSTFLGHPLGCAAALASMRVLEEEGLVDRSAREGDYLRKRLETRLGAHPQVGEVRGRGMMIGVEMVRDRASSEPFPEAVVEVVLEMLARGFLILGGGLHGNVLSISPPLTITRPQLDAAVTALVDVMATLRCGG